MGRRMKLVTRRNTWGVMESGGFRWRSVHRTRRAAEQAARALAEYHKGTEFSIYQWEEENKFCAYRWSAPKVS